jgi:hypothetical protein
MEKIGSGLYHFKFTHDFDYPETLLYKFTKGIGVKWKLTATATVLKTDPQQNTGIQKEHVGRWRKNWLPFKQNYLPSYLSLMNLKFLSNRTRKNGLPHDYDDSEERYPVMYLQDAQNLFNEDAEYGNWEIDKKLAVMSEYKMEKLS